MELKKIQYKALNARQKENYNYHKIASALAEYGYDCMRLNNDWEGADFIGLHPLCQLTPKEPPPTL